MAQSVKKGAHILVEGSLISSTYERPNGKGKKATQKKLVSWSIRADVVRRLDRGEPDPASPQTAATEAPASEDAAF